MNLIHTLAIVYTGMGLLVIGLAIPLILRRVPPNSLYGVRTKASFASESDWYHINGIGGRYLVGSGLIILVTGIGGFLLPASSRDFYAIGAGAATLLSIIVPCLRLSLLKPAMNSKDKSRSP